MCKLKVFWAVFVICLPLATSIVGQNIQRYKNLKSLINAERNFSRASVEKGMREAFLKHLHGDGVIFNPLPSNGKKIWGQREKTSGILSWIPVFADVSEDGNMGFTTGPFEFRSSPGEKPSRHGYYLSVWSKDSFGEWKVLLDIGTQNDAPESTPKLEFPHIPNTKSKKRFDAITDRSELEEADRNLSLYLSGEKSAVKLSDLSGEYFRLHRSGSFPIVENNKALAGLENYKGKIISIMTSSGVSQSGDFGYSYGTYQTNEKTDEDREKFNERGSYVRIWRQDGKGNWKINLVVMHTAPISKSTNQ